MDDLTKEIASLIIVDDDEIFRKRLLSAMEKKGYYGIGFGTVKESIQYIEKTPPNYAVIDLRLEDGNGLQVVSVLSKLKPECKIVILTGYGNIPTAVAAVSAGAGGPLRVMRAPGRHASCRRSAWFRSACNQGPGWEFG